MKRILSLVLALLLATVTLAACAKSYDTYNYKLDDYLNIPEYKGLPANATHYEVTDEAVKQQIDTTVNYYAKHNPVTDRPTKEGDTVTIDYVSYVKEISEEPKYIYDVDVTIGFGDFPEEFEKGLVGYSVGQTAYIAFTLPEDFPDYPEYAGMKAEFFVTFDSITENISPNYTDDFVRAYLNFDSIEEFEASVRKTLEEEAHDAFYDYTTSQTWDVILEGTEVKKYPEKELQENYDLVVKAVNDYVTALNLDFAAFVQSNFEMTEEEFYNHAMDTAKGYVKNEMLVNAIARREGIKVSDEDYEKFALKIAKDSYGLDSIAELEEKFSKKEIKQVVLEKLVKRFISDNASLTYVD